MQGIQIYHIAERVFWEKEMRDRLHIQKFEKRNRNKRSNRKVKWVG